MYGNPSANTLVANKDFCPKLPNEIIFKNFEEYKYVYKMAKYMYKTINSAKRFMAFESIPSYIRLFDSTEISNTIHVI